MSILDPRVAEWDRHCAARAIPEGTYEWLGLDWECDDDGARIYPEDAGWAEFLYEELPNLEWCAQRAIYAALAGLEEEPTTGNIPQSLCTTVEALLCEEALLRYMEEL